MTDATTLEIALDRDLAWFLADDLETRYRDMWTDDWAAYHGIGIEDASAPGWEQYARWLSPVIAGLRESTTLRVAPPRADDDGDEWSNLLFDEIWSAGRAAQQQKRFELAGELMSLAGRFVTFAGTLSQSTYVSSWDRGFALA